MVPPPTVAEATRTTPVVDRSDVLVVGGGPAGVSAAVAAARSGARVTLIERYPYLGGLASGGMVLVLDDMVNGAEITTTGLVGEWIGADLGLGALIIEATHNFRSPLLYATVFVSSAWAVVFFAVVSFAERRIVTWKQGEVS